MNAISDVVENRPLPLRQFDQIYMKSGDMLRQSEIVAEWADGKRLAFIGDGDGISITVAHLKRLGIFGLGPELITVFDFDERIINSVSRFAERLRISDLIQAELYNVADPFVQTAEYDLFYTNPPWGQHSEGESVAVFVQRGMEAIGFQGEGMIVIADDVDPQIDWPQKVLHRTQAFAISENFFVSRMMPRESVYHLYDEHEGTPSCNLVISSLNNVERQFQSKRLDSARRTNFYGRNEHLTHRYVREIGRPDYGKASEHEYTLEPIGD